MGGSQAPTTKCIVLGKLSLESLIGESQYSMYVCAMEAFKMVGNLLGPLSSERRFPNVKRMEKL